MELHELLRQIVETFESLNISYLITGSVASMAYGEPRLTNDIDLVAQITNDNVGGLMKAFPPNEFYISEDMVKEAIDRCGQFNIIHPISGLKVDVMIKQNTPFDQSRFKRVRRISPAESYQANFASPEDVIIKKMEYYRDGGSEKHLRDIAGILVISENEVDRDYISEWSRRLNLDEIWTAVQNRLEDKS